MRTIGLFGGGIVAALLAVLVYRAAFPGPAPLSPVATSPTSIHRALASQTPAPALSEAAFAAIRPSLVLIETTFPAQGQRLEGGPRQRRHHR